MPKPSKDKILQALAAAKCGYADAIGALSVAYYAHTNLEGETISYHLDTALIEAEKIVAKIKNAQVQS